MMHNKLLQHTLLFIVSILLFSSCGSVKHHNMLMLSEVQNQTTNIDKIPALTIQPDDILSIQVAGTNKDIVAFQTARVDNASGVGERALGVQEGYRVDEAGSIYLPFLGEVKAAGKTVLQLRNELAERLPDFFPNATVQVRFLNFRVTIMGEVGRPNTYVIPNERLNLLEAIGMAGDFTPYARRNSVLVIRERNEKREFARINVQDPSIFKSPYFYLSPNDVIVVEPLKAKQYATRGDFIDRYSGALIPVVSITTFLVGLLVNR
ncbi:MAG: polysaccharide biosynthesis/export family protein [Saprospiraceae bacterium]